VKLPFKKDRLSGVIATALHRVDVQQEFDARLASVRAAYEDATTEEASAVLRALDRSKVELRVSPLAVRLRVECQVLEHARPKAVEKPIESFRDIFRVASDLEHQTARELAEESDKTAQATLGPLAKLSELEEVSYTRNVLLHQRLGAWFRGFGIPATEDHLLSELTPDLATGARCAIPRSRRLRDESAVHTAKAREFEQMAETFKPWRRKPETKIEPPGGDEVRSILAASATGDPIQILDLQDVSVDDLRNMLSAVVKAVGREVELDQGA